MQYLPFLTRISVIDAMPGEDRNQPFIKKTTNSKGGGTEGRLEGKLANP